MALAYLLAEDARNKLIATEIYSEISCPSLSVLEAILEGVEAVIDGWIGARLAPTIYTETVRANPESVALTAQYPILRIISAEAIDLSAIGAMGSNSPNPIVFWEGDVRVIGIGGALAQVRLTYEAGLEPLPTVIKQIAFQALSRALAKTGKSGDLSFLSDPVKDVASISLPGNVSKTFRSGASKDGQSVSQLDRLLEPLSKYQRKIVI